MEKIILTEQNFSKLKNLVLKNKGKEIIFSSNNDELNRKIIEKLQINTLLISLENRKDYMKQRNSGFNEVMARISKKNGIKIGIDFDELIGAKEKEKIVSRIIQNVKLCSRNKVGMVFVEGKEKRDIHLLKSLGLVFGMPTWMTADLN
ncbi:hypothetical protein COU58_03225 [Candidatus Pacearchaeota archaeon CG10_big_fil_rev_8_21_14_0_10_32_42]|nr:MAG: hypothetical protein CO037_00090 [Candidatus Pacearchaeota archaeon CG_4_9_14_0_2_um_filter_30_8]PJE81304.1 MAG: hypothetical protein COU58_03225 [Candidatus Pacearchaeota archaeon CG10_big_fil_rev_8_21_14_0_10_32_42]